MKKSINLPATLLILATVISQTVYAHGRWLVPSHSNLSGDKPHIITLDMSISNELFKGDYAFTLLDKTKKQHPRLAPAELQLLTPQNETLADLPFNNFKRKSVAAVELGQNGTYRAVLKQLPVNFTQFYRVDGSLGRIFGTPDIAQAPANATNVKHVTMVPVMDTFISRNLMTEPPVTPTALAIKPLTHPNDLFINEPARFQFMLNGKVLKKAIKISATPAATRYRNYRNVINTQSDEQGVFTLTWPVAGEYLLEAEYDQQDEGKKVTKYAIYTVLEVNPT